MVNKKSKHIVTESEFILCPYCNNKFQFLHWKHLKSHDKKLEDVIIEFQNNSTMTKKEYDRRLKISKLGNDASKKSMSENKIINCFYCDSPKEVPKNYPNKLVCDNCLNNGKENIDKRTKEESKLKRIKTNIDKYGENYINVQHQNSMKTQNKKFNGQIGFANSEIKNKIEDINLEKYGSKNYMKSDIAMKEYISPALRYSVKEKISKKLKGKKSKNKGKSYIEILGKEKALDVINKKKENILIKFIPELNEILLYLDIELLDDNFMGAHFKHNWKCLKCENVFTQIWNKIQQGYLCANCYPRNQGFSKGEKEIAKFIKSNFDITENSRKIIPPQELDIFIPSKNIAIEFNGLYWHSEESEKDKLYHLNKTNNCLEKGIKLIHIFEDEWILKKNIVKSRLKQILNLNDSIRIHARKCEIKEVSPKIKNEFLNKYHIQGSDSSLIKIGAFYNNELVSIMTFSHGSISKGSKINNNNIWELSRFCSNHNYHIPGIASKLLSYFKKNYEYIEIFSYADRRWSDGNLYYKLGFKLDSITKPNYFYIKGLRRIHRFNLRKKYDEPKYIPEWILRLNEGYNRIWDCGHYKFIMKK